MKKKSLTVAVVCALAASMMLPSCIGSFTLTNKLLTWNRQVSNKFVNELVFFAFWVLPVYEVSALADVIVLNSIEFWSGTNPVASGTQRVKGADGEYLVKADKTGYTITNEADGSSVRLNYSSKDNSWNIVTPAGEEMTIFSFVDDTHISVPTPAGENKVVETSQAGVYAYSQIATAASFAQR